MRACLATEACATSEACADQVGTEPKRAGCYSANDAAAARFSSSMDGLAFSWSPTSVSGETTVAPSSKSTSAASGCSTSASLSDMSDWTADAALLDRRDRGRRRRRLESTRAWFVDRTGTESSSPESSSTSPHCDSSSLSLPDASVYKGERVNSGSKSLSVPVL